MSETTDSKPMLASGPALSMGSLQVSLPAAVQDHLPEKETGARAYPDDSVWIESLNLDAQGVAHRPDGKVVFVDGALPFEQVSASTYRRKSNWEQANLTAIHVESSQRVRPGCPHFGLHAGSCGGCKMQHLHPAAQVAVKQRVLEDNLWHLGKVKPETLLRPIEGPAWGYRYRARLSVRYVIKKGEVLIGFHERKSRYVADMRVCPVLAPHVSAMLLPLRQLVASMDARDTLPQMELACGDDQTAMVLRHLEPLSEADLARLRAFGEAHGMQWWLQSKGPDTVRLLDEASPPLTYALPEFGITMPFKPTDFTQVNPHINRVLVSRALRLLDVQQSERVIDWFCGLGNFTLPLATKAREVLGIEGSAALVARAQENFDSNQALALTHKSLAATKFVARNLFEMTPSMLVADGTADKWLVDPPREGALALVTALAHIEQARAAGDKAIVAEAENPVVSGDEGDWKSDAERPVLPEGASNWAPPRRIVYVSCNPATLARDAEVLVHQAGYRCIAAGAINMFPHTAHVESMAVFERDA